MRSRPAAASFSRIILLGAALALVALALVPPALFAQSQEPGDDVRISVDVRRVVLYATVHDTKAGTLVGDLQKADFTVKDNGHIQEIREFQREDVPAAVGLIVDNSQSMMNKGEEIISAAKTFIRTSNPQDEMFVVHFNDDVQFGLPPKVLFTSDHAALEHALNRFTTEGKTALYDAIFAGLRRLQQSNLTKKALVVISDGGDNASKRSFRDVTNAAGVSGAMFYAIGLYDPNDGDANPRNIRRLANETGGISFFPQKVEEVAGLCESIARDLRNQYMLVYAPAEQPQDASFHKVQVSVKDPKHRRLTVRTRTGYYGPAAERGLLDKIP
jgi:Ca-activated chloride channel family protein